MRTDSEYIAQLLVKYPEIILWKLTKVQSITDSSKNSDYEEGYWVVGENIGHFKTGEMLLISRVANSNYPEGRVGLWNTSPITVIDESNSNFAIITTKNSVYKLEKLTK